MKYANQDERGKDEFSTRNQIKKHERLQSDIDKVGLNCILTRDRHFNPDFRPFCNHSSPRDAVATRSTTLLCG